MNEIEKMAHILKLSHIKSSYKQSISEAMDKNASSIASLLITSEAAIVNLKENNDN